VHFCSPLKCHLQNYDQTSDWILIAIFGCDIVGTSIYDPSFFSYLILVIFFFLFWMPGAIQSLVFECLECSIIFSFEFPERFSHFCGCPECSSHLISAQSALVTLLFECPVRSHYFVIWMPGALWSFVFGFLEGSGHFLIWLPRALQYYFLMPGALQSYLH